MASPSKLYFTRSLEIGFAIMSSKCSETGKVWTLNVQPPRHIKGPPRDYASLSGSNEQNLDTPNVYLCEFICNEPGDTLRFVFEGYIHRNAFSPITPDASAKHEILEFLELYRDKQGFEHLAGLILQNLLNFRWLRRNNTTFQYKRQIVFETLNFEHVFTLPDWFELPELDEIQSSAPNAVQECADFIATRLYQENVDRWFKVTAELYTGTGLNIFPSQGMNIKNNTSGSSKKEKKGQPFQKTIDKETGRRDVPLLDGRHIIYALYTVDTSYKEGDNLEPINNNPTGFVESEGTHHRDYGRGNCVYNYQEQLKALTKELKKIDDTSKIPEKMHYLACCYVQGGNYNGKNE